MNSKTPIKILVTGGGSQLAQCLKDAVKNYPHLHMVFKTRMELDITQRHQLEKAFTSKTYDFCINTAAYTAVDKAEEDKGEAYKVNAEGVRYLAEICKEYRTTLVHLSTDFIFDGTVSRPYRTTDSTHPINVYGTSKLLGEDYIKEVLEHYIIIRTSWLYSEYGTNFVKTMLRLGKTKDEIKVVADQVGSPTYAKDLAGVLCILMTTHPDLLGTYHFANAGQTSWYGFAQAIFNITDIEVKLTKTSSNLFSQIANRPKYSVLDTSELQNILNFEIPNWKVSLEHMLRHQQPIKE